MKPGEHHQGGLVPVDDAGQLGIERFPAGEALVIDHLAGDALLAREDQATGIGAIADDGRDPGVPRPAPILALGAANDGGHVGAAAGDQNDDVLHFLSLRLSLPCHCAH